MNVKEVIEKLQMLPADKIVVMTGGTATYPILNIHYLDWADQVIIAGGWTPLEEVAFLENLEDEILDEFENAD